MRQTTGTRKSPGEKIVKDIKRATRKQYSSEEKIRIILEGLRGEDSIAELCRREGISQGVYYKWSKDFMEAGKKRLAGDTARATRTDEVKDLRREARNLKEVVAAFEIHSGMAALAAETSQPFSVHIEIASGAVIAGRLGSDGHKEYTVIGDTVNLASRLDGIDLSP